MSPTIFRYKEYRFFFFSREEKRLHVHVDCADGEAKFWLDPVISLADYKGLKAGQLKRIQKIIESRKNEIVKAWNQRSGS